MARLVVLLALVVSLARPAFAVDGPGDEKALPCRPTIACTADIVAPGDFEIEAGYIARRFRDSTLQQETPLLLKLSLTDWLQLQVGSNGAIFARGPLSQSYVDDISIGGKLHLIDQSARMPSLAFSAALSVPLPGQPPSLRSYDWLFIGYLTKDVWKLHFDWNLGFNLWNLNAPLQQLWTALAISWNLPRDFGAMVEGYYFSNAAPIAARDEGFLFAVAYSARSWLIFDLGGDVGFAYGRQFAAFVGLTVVPVRLWGKRTRP